VTERLQVIPTLPGMGRSLIAHDEKSKMYPARGLLSVDQLKPRDRVWRRGGPYDQSNSSTCVTHTGKGMLNTAPLSSKASYYRRSRYDPFAWYPEVQRRDEWPGESPDYEGTSGLGLCKYLLEIGLIEEYRWNFGLQDTLLSLSHVGPVGLGIWWKSGMWRTDADGYIHATGENEGGHEVELIGVDVSERCVIGMNSWGDNWGVRGRFKLHWEDLETLLAEQGDAFVIIK